MQRSLRRISVQPQTFYFPLLALLILPLFIDYEAKICLKSYWYVQNVTYLLLACFDEFS